MSTRTPQTIAAHIQPALFGVAQTTRTSDDYYTPAWVFERMGRLAQPWTGRVWMNPPYSAATAWVTKFIDHRNGIALLPHAKSAWHPTLWTAADGVVVPFEYFDFIGGSIMMPVWFAAFGDECVEAISRLGVLRITSAQQVAQ